jgi:UTP--glucose-1-phosphate uridylyltransferase
MVKRALFPAAGYGTRFLPATKSVPKEMLPIVNKPLIHYAIEECLEAGIDQIGFITGRNKRAIEDYLDHAPELEHHLEIKGKGGLLKEVNRLMEKCTFTYVRQKKMRGLGDAVLTGEPLVGGEPFAVVLADDLCLGNPISQMVKLFHRYRCSIVAVEEIDISESEKYGIIEGREVEEGVFVVERMVEKPAPSDAPSNLAIIGRYILTPEIFDYLRTTPPGRGGEVQLTDALNRLAGDHLVIAYRFKGKRFDCGSVEGFIEATNHFYNLLSRR